MGSMCRFCENYHLCSVWVGMGKNCSGPWKA
jgi:hypothetical protein